MSSTIANVRERVRPDADEERAEEELAPQEPPAREYLLRALERGRSLDHALISQVRALLAEGEHDRARSLALGLREQPETETLGRLAGGIVAQREGYSELAWDLMRPVSREAWTRFAVSEFVRSGLSVAPEEVLAELRALVADDPPEVRSKFWYDMLAPVFGYGEGELARQIYERFDRHAREDENPWDEAERKRDWIQPWIASDPGSATAPATGRRRAVAARSRSWTTGTRAPIARRPTSATTSRASRRSATWSATRACGCTGATTSWPCSNGCASARGRSGA